MNTTTHYHELPAGDDRLIDALLREHARAGTGADEPFLARLNRAIEAEMMQAGGPPDEAARVPAAGRRHLTPRIAWSLGLAAAVVLVAGLLWRMPVGRPAGMSAESVQARAGHGARLHTEIPPELIEGTPKAIKVRGLVAVPTAAPTLLVPEGTVLLSRGKPVTSSDDNPIIGTLDLITDGDKEAGEGYFVELLEGKQWVQIDLERSAAVQAVWVWHFHSQRRAYHDVIVQLSDDPQFKAGVTTIYNNDYDGSAKMGKATDNPYVESRFGLLVDAGGAKGRYVRLYSNGNTSNEMNHYIEVEVFGLSS